LLGHVMLDLKVITLFMGVPGSKATHSKCLQILFFSRWGLELTLAAFIFSFFFRSPEVGVVEMYSYYSGRESSYFAYKHWLIFSRYLRNAESGTLVKILIHLHC
jgi:hypothetical protein